MKTEYAEILGALEFLEKVELWLHSLKLKSFNLGYEFITIESCTSGKLNEGDTSSVEGLVKILAELTHWNLWV